MTDLFALESLAAFMQQDLDTASASICRDVVTGLFLAELFPAVLPDSIPASLSAAGLRVAARLYVNPGELSQESAGNWSASYASADLTDSERRIVRRTAGWSSVVSAPLANRFGEVLELPVIP